MSQPQSKLHYHLASGYVFCHPANKPEEAGELRANAVITTQSQNITAAELGRAQGALAMEIRRRSEGVELSVLDVTLSAISYLGEMTPAEFAPPTPTAVSSPASVN
jgi:hypothetical protein